MVVSSYSDLGKASRCVRRVHFRKFVSKKLLKEIIAACPQLAQVSFSPYAYSRLNGLEKELVKRNISVVVINRPAGRPIKWR